MRAGQTALRRIPGLNPGLRRGFRRQCRDFSRFRCGFCAVRLRHSAGVLPEKAPAALRQSQGSECLQGLGGRHLVGLPVRKMGVAAPLPAVFLQLCRRLFRALPAPGGGKRDHRLRRAFAVPHAHGGVAVESGEPVRAALRSLRRPGGIRPCKGIDRRRGDIYISAVPHQREASVRVLVRDEVFRQRVRGVRRALRGLYPGDVKGDERPDVGVESLPVKNLTAERPQPRRQRRIPSGHGNAYRRTLVFRGAHESSGAVKLPDMPLNGLRVFLRTVRAVEPRVAVRRPVGGAGIQPVPEILRAALPHEVAEALLRPVLPAEFRRGGKSGLHRHEQSSADRQ